MFVRNILLNFRGQETFEFLHGRCVGVDKERTAVFDVAGHIVARNVRGVGALNEVCGIDEILGLYRRISETEVRNGYAARLLRIVEEISLRVLVRMVADNFNGVFIRADSSVRTETVEFTACRTCGSGVELLGEVEGCICNVFVNTDCEMILGLSLFEIFINRENHRGGELFRA